MAKPFQTTTPDNIPQIAMRVILRAGEDGEGNPVEGYDFNVDYSVYDEDGESLGNYDGDIRDELTTGEKTQLSVIIGRLRATALTQHGLS